MPGTSYTMPLRVRLYDLDIHDEVSNATLFRFFEETAMQASSHLGFTLDWYHGQQRFWVIRSIRMERVAPALYQDEMEIRTWVSAMGRIRADRNYLVRRALDGCILARATSNWVYLDSRTMFPARIDPSIAAMFRDTEPPPLGAPRARPWLCPTRPPVEWLSKRTAQQYEADGARHTNNAVYVDWLEEAVRDTLLSSGMPVSVDETPSLRFSRHSLEYLSAARPGDHVEIVTRLAGQGRSAGLWQQEIRRAGSGSKIVQAECMTLWRGADGRPAEWPERTS